MVAASVATRAGKASNSPFRTSGAEAIVAKKPDEVAREWFERVWNRGEESAIDELFASDGRMFGLPTGDGRPLVGPAGFKPFYRRFREAFPDMRIEIVRTITEGDLVAVQARVTGTHTGAGLDLAPTRNAVEVWGMGMARVAEGRIVEAWNAYDFMALYMQLGLVQMPASAHAATHI
jgi:predicted ester cyclase